jgi:hypothetical protein
VRWLPRFTFIDATRTLIPAEPSAFMQKCILLCKMSLWPVSDPSNVWVKKSVTILNGYLM